MQNGDSDELGAQSGPPRGAVSSGAPSPGPESVSSCHGQGSEESIRVVPTRFPRCSPFLTSAEANRDGARRTTMLDLDSPTQRSASDSESVLPGSTLGNAPSKRQGAESTTTPAWVTAELFSHSQPPESSERLSALCSLTGSDAAGDPSVFSTVRTLSEMDADDSESWQYYAQALLDTQPSPTTCVPTLRGGGDRERLIRVPTHHRVRVLARGAQPIHRHAPGPPVSPARLPDRLGVVNHARPARRGRAGRRRPGMMTVTDTGTQAGTIVVFVHAR